MPADALQAGAVAYQGFLNSLEKQKSPDKDFSKFMSSASNYSTKISVLTDSYVFTFLPNRYNGGVVKGAVVYKVDLHDHHLEGGSEK